MTGFPACLRLCAALLLARLLPRLILAATLAAAAVAVLWSDAHAGEGYRLLAGAADLLVVVVTTFAAILGAVAVAGDVTPGSLRAVLVRPVARPALVLAHAVVLVLFTLVLYLLGLAVALLLVVSRVGFDDVRLGDFVITTAAAMDANCVRLLLLPLPALCCAPLLALVVSAVSEDVASSVVISLALVGGPTLFGKLIGELPSWTFPAHALHPVSVLVALAQGDNTRELTVRGTQYLLTAITEPALWAALFLAAAMLLFHRREIRA